METISLRLENEFLHDVESAMKKYRYATKTEFVRAALRDKINKLKKEDLVQTITALAGSSKKKTSEAELHLAGEKAFKLLEKKQNSR